MSEQIIDPAAASWSVEAAWHPVGSSKRLLIELTLASTSEADTSATVTLRKDLVPANAFIGSDLKTLGQSEPPLRDVGARKWKAGFSPFEQDYIITLEVEAGETEAASWKLHFFLELAKPASGSAFQVTIAVGSATRTADVTIPDEAAPPPLEELILDADPSPSNALQRWQRVTLSWSVSGIDGKAELTGAMQGANTRPISNESEGSIEVMATGTAVYTLTATTKTGKFLIRQVIIGIAPPQRGGTLVIWPTQVFPGGPLACYWAAYNVRKLRFQSIGGGAPGLGAHGFDSKLERKDEFESFSLVWGPGTDRGTSRWTIAAEYAPLAGPKDSGVLSCDVTVNVPDRLLPGPWPHLAQPYASGAGETAAPPPRVEEAARITGPVKVVAMAAGTFSVEKNKHKLSSPVSGTNKTGQAGKAPDAGKAPKTQVSGGAARLAAERNRQEQAALKAAENLGPRLVERSWVAVATNLGLEVHVHSENKALRVTAANQDNIPWLKAALEGDFVGVGAAHDVAEMSPRQPIAAEDAAASPAAKKHALRHWVIAVRRAGKQPEPGALEVTEFPFPLTPSDPRPAEPITLGEEGFCKAPRVRVVTVGARVFLLGNAVAVSYDRCGKDQTKRNEPRLVQVAGGDWEVVAIPAPRTAGEKLTQDGHIFALHTKGGMLLRFDVVNGEVKAPVQPSPANDVAPLHLLQQAQLGVSEYLDGHAYAGALNDGRVVQWKSYLGARSVVDPVDDRSTLVAVGGALLVRSEVPDPTVGGAIQDRVYDPRRNVWVRCGHPFSGAKKSEGALFASTAKTLYCRTPDGEIGFVTGNLLSLLGFRTDEITPIDADKLPAVHRLAPGLRLIPGMFLSSPDGKLELICMNDGTVEIWDTRRRQEPAGRLWVSRTSDEQPTWEQEQYRAWAEGGYKTSSLLLTREGHLAREDAAGLSLMWHRQPFAEEDFTSRQKCSCPVCMKQKRMLRSELTAGDSLALGWTMRSPDLRFELVFQEWKYEPQVPNLELRDRTRPAGSPPLWTVNTGANLATELAVDDTGKVTLYNQSPGDRYKNVEPNPRGAVGWSSDKDGGRTGNYPGSRLRLTNDGHLICYNSDLSIILWHSYVLDDASRRRECGCPKCLAKEEASAAAEHRRTRSEIRNGDNLFPGEGLSLSGKKSRVAIHNGRLTLFDERGVIVWIMRDNRVFIEGGDVRELRVNDDGFKAYLSGCKWRVATGKAKVYDNESPRPIEQKLSRPSSQAQGRLALTEGNLIYFGNEGEVFWHARPLPVSDAVGRKQCGCRRCLAPDTPNRGARLAAGEFLIPGEFLVSPGGRRKLVVTGSGAELLDESGKNAGFNAGQPDQLYDQLELRDRLIEEDDTLLGNGGLVLVRADGALDFTPFSDGRDYSASALALRDSGLVVYGDNGSRILFHTSGLTEPADCALCRCEDCMRVVNARASRTSLGPGEFLAPGESVKNGDLTLEFKPGRAELRSGKDCLWYENGNSNSDGLDRFMVSGTGLGITIGIPGAVSPDWQVHERDFVRRGPLGTLHLEPELFRLVYRAPDGGILWHSDPPEYLNLKKIDPLQCGCRKCHGYDQIHVPILYSGQFLTWRDVLSPESDWRAGTHLGNMGLRDSKGQRLWAPEGATPEKLRLEPDLGPVFEYSDSVEATQRYTLSDKERERFKGHYPILEISEKDNLVCRPSKDSKVILWHPIRFRDRNDPRCQQCGCDKCTPAAWDSSPSL